MKVCSHCNEAAPVPLLSPENPALTFCCQGCLTVYHIIHQKGLDAYYSIKQESGIFRRRAPVESTEGHFSYIDDASFLHEYTYSNGHGEKVMEFYLEGIHCLACLWLIEKIGETLPGIINIKLEMNRSVAVVTGTDSAKFGNVAAEFNRLGYRPHPLKRNQESLERKKKEERAMLTRIGIAGASSGNIMLYAISLYGGAATSEFVHLFHSLTVFFALPVLIYCSYPFYKNAWLALKSKTVNIDVPISLALIVGGIAGFIYWLRGIEYNYFDSLTALVFLLLLSRYFLMKIQEKGLSTNDLQFSHLNESVLKASSDSLDDFSSIHIEKIQTGDRLKVSSGEIIPADGQIIRGSSAVNNSLLTGESQPVDVNPGSEVYSGAMNLNSEIIIEVEKTRDDTRLGKILKTVEQGWSLKSPVAQLTNEIAKYFVIIVCVLSAVLFFWLFPTKGFETAFASAITLLIVTCPCALAIAVPLSFYRSLSSAATHGVIIKSDEAIEKIAKVKNIFLDKTGTITYGKLQVASFTVNEIGDTEIYNIIYSLEQKSQHPVARALLEFLTKTRSDLQVVALQDYRETLGRGVEAKVHGDSYQIVHQKVYKNGLIAAEFTLSDIVREESAAIIRELKNMGLNVFVLSGDRSDIVQTVSVQVGLKTEEVFGDLSPEEKAKLIKSKEATLMVGDGANDAIAFKHADVGVAVLGAMDISLKACDVYMTSPGLAPVRDLIILSRQTMKVIRRNLILSLLYNSLSVVATFAGVISPLVAAIIMPVSSLTVAVSTIIGTKKLRTLWK